MALQDVLKQAQTVAQGVGGVIDSVLPVAVGDRTKWTVVVAAAAPKVGALACSLFPQACPYVALVGQLSTLLVPLFAYAGLVRPAAATA
jgi:hypothetical protein